MTSSQPSHAVKLPYRIYFLDRCATTHLLSNRSPHCIQISPLACLREEHGRSRDTGKDSHVTLCDMSCDRGTVAEDETPPDTSGAASEAAGSPKIISFSYKVPRAISFSYKPPQLGSNSVASPKFNAQVDSKGTEDVSEATNSNKQTLETNSEPLKINSEPLDATSEFLSCSKPLKAFSEPRNAKSEPLNAKSESLNVKSEPLNVKSEPLNFKSEPLKVKSEPLNAKSEPLKVKSEPLNVKSEPLNAKSEPLNVKSEPLNAKSMPLNATKSHCDRLPSSPSPDSQSRDFTSPSPSDDAFESEKETKIGTNNKTGQSACHTRDGKILERFLRRGRSESVCRLITNMIYDSDESGWSSDEGSLASSRDGVTSRDSVTSREARSLGGRKGRSSSSNELIASKPRVVPPGPPTRRSTTDILSTPARRSAVGFPLHLFVSIHLCIHACIRACIHMCIHECIHQIFGHALSFTLVFIFLHTGSVTVSFEFHNFSSCLIDAQLTTTKALL